MAYIRQIVVVCGYGCNLQSPLKPYLDKIADFCKAGSKSSSCISIIPCGGATQRKSFPGKTEAGVIAGYLYGKFPALWYLEENSYTTYDNVQNAASIILKLKAKPWHGIAPRHDEITIWCEATRALKVAFLARYFLGFPPERGEPDIRIMTDSWERMHPIVEFIATAKDVLATCFPYLNTLQHNQRIAKSLTR